MEAKYVKSNATLKMRVEVLEKREEKLAEIPSKKLVLAQVRATLSFLKNLTEEQVYKLQNLLAEYTSFSDEEEGKEQLEYLKSILKK
jgi:hypothetical protein